MAESLTKPRPAVEAFFEQFDDELVEHFTNDGTFDPDLVKELDFYNGTDQYNSALLNFWVENEKLLHKNSGDRITLVRLDVDLMMSVYMFDVLYCLDNDGQKPVMAAYEFVVANSDWFRDNQVELYEDGTLFKKVLDTLKSEVFFGEGSIQMDWINRLTDGTTLANEPKTLTELKEAIRIVTESPDRGGAIVPSVNPPSAIKRFIDTARPVFEVLVLPATAVSALLGAVIAGSDAAIRRTANIRNLTETEQEYQDDLQASADRDFDTWAQTPPLDLTGNSVGFTDMELMNAKLWAFDQGYGIEYLGLINEDPGEQQRLIEEYRNSESAGTDSGYPASFLDRVRQRDAMKRLDQLNQRKEAARARARQNLEALPPPEQFFPEPDGFLFDEENPGNDFSGIGRGGSEPEPGQRDEVGSGQQSADGQSDPPFDDFDFSSIDSETGQTIGNGGGRPRPNLVDSDNGSFGLNATDAEDAGDSGFAGDPNVEEIQADDGPEIRIRKPEPEPDQRTTELSPTQPNYERNLVKFVEDLSSRGRVNVFIQLQGNSFMLTSLPFIETYRALDSQFRDDGVVNFYPISTPGERFRQLPVLDTVHVNPVAVQNAPEIVFGEVIPETGTTSLYYDHSRTIENGTVTNFTDVYRRRSTALGTVTEPVAHAVSSVVIGGANTVIYPAQLFNDVFRLSTLRLASRPPLELSSNQIGENGAPVIDLTPRPTGVIPTWRRSNPRFGRIDRLINYFSESDWLRTAFSPPGTGITVDESAVVDTPPAPRRLSRWLNRGGRGSALYNYFYPPEPEPEPEPEAQLSFELPQQPTSRGGYQRRGPAQRIASNPFILNPDTYGEDVTGNPQLENGPRPYTTVERNEAIGDGENGFTPAPGVGFPFVSGPGVTPVPGIGVTGSNLDSPPSRRRKFAFKL